jgi:hypothetical protein
VELKNCWDCPISLFVLAAAAAATLHFARRRILQAVGAVLIFLTLFWAAVVTHGIGSWGILRSERAFDVFPSWASWIMLATLDACIIATILAVRQWRRRTGG